MKGAFVGKKGILMYFAISCTVLILTLSYPK